jgi:cytochrome c-type biogenesis protein CcsB
VNLYFFYIAVALYLLSTLFYLLFLPIPRPSVGRTAQITLIGAFVTHTASIVTRYIEAGYTPITNFHEALSFFALAVGAAFLYLNRSFKLAVLGSMILPLLSLMVISAAFLPGQIRPLPPVLRSSWLPIHTIFIFAGNAMFVVSFFISLGYLVLERRVKTKKPSSLSSRLPPLQALDSINYRCMSLGFPFLTVGIITGSIWAGLAWGSYWSWDPKETFSLITWIVYAILIHNRLALGWRGRRTAYMMIVGFLSILLTFLGVNFLLGGLHSYL